MELFDRWCAGDRGAGNELFKRYFYNIYEFFENKVQDGVDELVQSTFLACTHSRDKFRRQSSFRTYLFTIARHELYGYLRRRKRDGDRLDFGVTSLADMNLSPTGKIARDEEHNLLLRALRMLPVEQQVLLELYYWEGMTGPQLAEVFGTASTAMRARLTRARKTLRTRMQELGDAPTAKLQTLDGLDAWARSIRSQRSE